MGKIRVKVLGDEEAEKKQKDKAEKRAEAKEARHSGEEQRDDSGISLDAADPGMTEDSIPEAPKKKVVIKKTSKEKTHSTKYSTAAKLVNSDTTYKLSEAVTLLPKLTIAKFDETVELHINTTDKGISGQMTLPHGTGKQVRVVIMNPSEDAASADELVKKIEGGTIDFDVLIATPDAMPRLARVARVLGPRGLMPNPKNGTVTPKPEEAAKKFAGGQMNYKTEAKFPILHLVVGKVSFGEQKLEENIKTALKTVKTQNIRNVTLKSTMSPGIKVDIAGI